MRKPFFLFFILYILFSIHSFAQIQVAFGPKPMTSQEENAQNMARLIRKGYRLPIYYTGDSIADTILIHEVILADYGNEYYYVLYKSDTAKVAIAIQKLPKNDGYRIIAYWDNMYVKRLSEYNKKASPSGKWIEYFLDGHEMLKGKYLDGSKIGKWKYYAANGDRVLTERYVRLRPKAQ